MTLKKIGKVFYAGDKKFPTLSKALNHIVFEMAKDNLKKQKDSEFPRVEITRRVAVIIRNL